MDEPTLYLKAKRDDVAPLAVLVGDPSRVDLFRHRLDGAKTVAQAREFTTVTGRYEGVDLSVVAIGIGAPAAAIALEELASLGVKAVIRAGTMMAVRAPLGSLILAQAACRMESTSRTYEPLEVPAVADADLFASFRAVLEEAGIAHATGLVGTADGFYSEMMPARSAEPSLLMQQFRAWGVLGADMETSAVYVIARSLGIKAVSCCLGTVEAGTRRMLEAEERRRLERVLVDAVLHVAREFVERSST